MAVLTRLGWDPDRRWSNVAGRASRVRLDRPPEAHALRGGHPCARRAHSRERRPAAGHGLRPELALLARPGAQPRAAVDRPLPVADLRQVVLPGALLLEQG